MDKQPRWLYILNSFSTTNLRVYVTLFMVIATGFNLFFTGKVDANWLIFLGAMAGIDTAQFTAKRFSHRPDGTTETQILGTGKVDDLPPPSSDAENTDTPDTK